MHNVQIELYGRSLSKPITQSQLMKMTWHYRQRAERWFLFGLLGAMLALASTTIMLCWWFAFRPAGSSWLAATWLWPELAICLSAVLVAFLCYRNAKRLAHINDVILNAKGYAELHQLLNAPQHWTEVMLYLAQLAQERREITNGDLFVIKQRIRQSVQG